METPERCVALMHGRKEKQDLMSSILKPSLFKAIIPKEIAREGRGEFLPSLYQLYHEVYAS
jgi:hypothetical protein